MQSSIHLGWKSQGLSSSSEPVYYLLDLGTDPQDLTDFSSFFKNLSIIGNFPGEPFQPFTSRIDDRYDAASTLLDSMADIRQLFEEIPNERSRYLTLLRLLSNCLRRHRVTIWLMSNSWLRRHQMTA